MSSKEKRVYGFRYRCRVCGRPGMYVSSEKDPSCPECGCPATGDVPGPFMTTGDKGLMELRRMVEAAKGIGAITGNAGRDGARPLPEGGATA